MIKVKEIERGKTFWAAGIEWMVYEKSIGTSYVISNRPVEYMEFDVDGSNNFEKSSLRQYLNGAFLRKMEISLGSGALKQHIIDLTGDDGTTRYGSYIAKVGLLTHEDYIRNRGILKPVAESWWLATPYSTELENERNDHVCTVTWNGTISEKLVYDLNSLGVRPTLLVDDETFVYEYEDEEKRRIESLKSKKNVGSCPKMTNGDKIRSLSDEELAKLIMAWVSPTSCKEFWDVFLKNKADDIWWKVLLKGEDEDD